MAYVTINAIKYEITLNSNKYAPNAYVYDFITNIDTQRSWVNGYDTINGPAAGKYPLYGDHVWACSVAIKGTAVSDKGQNGTFSQADLAGNYPIGATNSATSKTIGAWMGVGNLDINYYLDINGIIDGTTFSNLGNAATATVKINNNIVSANIIDFYTAYPPGTSYEVIIQPNIGYLFVDSNNTGYYSGVLNEHIAITPSLKSVNYYLDLNGNLDGDDSGSLQSQYGYQFARANIKVNNELVAENVLGHYQKYPVNSSYEVTVNCNSNYAIKPGYVKSKTYTGTITSYTEVKPEIVRQYTLDLNSYDGNYGDFLSTIYRFATADIYIDGKLIAEDTVNTYYYCYCGQAYKVVIKANPGYKFSSADLDGKIGGLTSKSLNSDSTILTCEGVIPSYSIQINPTFERVLFTNTIAHWGLGFNGTPNVGGYNNNGKAFKLAETSFQEYVNQQIYMSSGRKIDPPRGFSLNDAYGTSSFNSTWESFIMPQTHIQPANNLHFEYYYSPINYDIKYELNGGNNPDSAPKQYNVLYRTDLPVPQRYGYTFDGWYLDSNFTTYIESINPDAPCTTGFSGVNELYSKCNKQRIGEIKLYAKWKFNPSVWIKDQSSIPWIKSNDKYEHCIAWVYKNNKWVSCELKPASMYKTRDGANTFKTADGITYTGGK